MKIFHPFSSRKGKLCLLTCVVLYSLAGAYDRGMLGQPGESEGKLLEIYSWLSVDITVFWWHSHTVRAWENYQH